MTTSVDLFADPIAAIKTHLATAILAAGALTASAPWTLTQTWNEGATAFSALKVNVTDTASTSASLLADFQLGGVSKFSVRKDGRATAVSFSRAGDISASAWTTNGICYANAAGTLTDTSSSGTVATAYTSVFAGNTIAASSATTFTNYFGVYVKDPSAGANVTLTNKYALGADSIRINSGKLYLSDGTNVVDMYCPQSNRLIFEVQVNREINGNGFGLGTTLLYWGANSAYANADVILARDAANTLALRNSTNAQAMLFSAGYTDASNYSHLRIDAGKTTSAVHRLMSVAAGSGTLRPIAIDGYAKSGAPTSTELPAGTWGVFKDSGGGGVVLAYNDAGTIKSASLT